MARDAPDQFVTASAVLIDPDAGTLAVCNAGHVPPVLVRPDGTADLIELGAGVPLGVLPRLHRQTETVTLEPGSVVVLVTDGVVESRDHDVDEGIERLRALVAGLADRPLEELVAAAASLADGRLADDVTVVAARLR
jgi:serine phosphatase RsbU (regulator of sigma subunit)